MENTHEVASTYESNHINELDEVLSLISQKKRELIQEAEKAISNIQKLVSEKLTHLKQLKEEPDKNHTKDILDQIQPQKLFIQLGFAKGITNLTEQLSKANEKDRSRSGIIDELNQMINSLKNELQKTKQVYENQLKELKNQVKQRGQTIQEHEKRIGPLRKELQKTKQHYDKLRTQMEQQRVSSSKKLSEIEQAKDQRISVLENELQKNKQDYERELQELINQVKQRGQKFKNTKKGSVL